MSEDFYSKDYGEYFKTLEEKQTGETKVPKTQNETQEEVKRASFRLPVRFIALILAVVLIIVAALFVFAKKEKTEPYTQKQTQTTPKKEKDETYKIAEITSDTPNPTAEITSNHIVMIDTKTNKAVAARNPEERTSPASTTKIMTILVAAENISSYSETFIMTREITDEVFLAEATAAGFKVGENVTFTDLLYGTILPSGADAALGLAHKISGSEEEFVKLMNKKVKELGLKNTNFTNVTGLYGEDHYSTVLDMAVILKAAMDNEICRQVLSAHPYTTCKTPEHPEGIELQSTLFSSMYGNEPVSATIDGGKTGYVNQSGFCIASFGHANESGREYICVTFDAQSKWPSVNDQIKMYSTYAK